MKTLLRGYLKELMERPAGPVVSLFMSTQRTGDTLQGPVRLDNLLRQADLQLVSGGLRAPVARRLLQPARGLLTDAAFWRNMGDGLAMFLSDGEFRHFRLPYSFPEEVVVSDRYHIKPVLELFSGDRLFYILAVSLKAVRLLQCTRDGFTTATPGAVPQGMYEARRYDGPERQVQFHTGPGSGTGRRAAIYHGPGGDTGYTKKDMLHYLQQVDHGLHDVLKDETAPLLLASVDYLQPIYRQANRYRYLLSQAIEGNPDDASSEQLHRKAWPLVQPYFEDEKAKGRRLYSELAGTGRVTNDVQQAVLAAADGRVFLLFVGADIHRWGRLDLDSRSVVVHDQAGPGDQDLVDLAVADTIRTGGTTYVVDAEQVPGGQPLAAVLRYA